MEVCAAAFSGGLYPSERRVTMPLKAHVDLPGSVCPMCWCTWGVEVAVTNILLRRLLSGGCCPGHQGQSCPRHYWAMVQRPPVLRATEGILMLQGPQDKLSCRSLGCPPAAGGKSPIWIFEIHWAWCDAQKYHLGLFHGLQQGFQALLWVQKA